MNNEVIVTCAVTGAGDTVGKHPAIPVTPQQIADAAIEAATAGAAVAHIHVRDPETGKGSRDPRALPRSRRADARQQRGCRSSTSPPAWAAISRCGDPRARSSSAPTRIWSARSSGWCMSRSCCRRSARSIAARSISAMATLSLYRRQRSCAQGAKRIRELGREARAGGLRYRPSLVCQADAQRRSA